MDKEHTCDATQDYPLSEAPIESRKSLASTSIVLLGFTFFTATMWGGGKLGVGFDFKSLISVITIGNLLLGAYVAILGYIAFKSGLNSVLMSRFGFGDYGSKWPDFVLGFTQIGWYAWGTATVALVFTKLLNLPEVFNIPLMVLSGFAFCWTAYIGYRGLEMLSIFAVPAMCILIALSFTVSTRDIGGLTGLLKVTPTEPIGWGAALTIVFGTFVSGGTQATNWTRFSKTANIAVFASLIAFFIGNGLMIFAGAYGAIVYQEADIVNVLAKQGLLAVGILMLFLNIWTTQDNTIYNFSVAGCNLLRNSKRKMITIGGAALGTLLAILGMYNYLIPYLILLGTFIPPIGGVIMADFFYKHKGLYPSLKQVRLKKFNYTGITSYIIASAAAYFSPGVAPINGIIAAVASYIAIDTVFNALGFNQDHSINTESHIRETAQ
ncbi:MAG: cytosine permease [Desulfobacteraceae bacterium]|nr:cytosine permease [Desulfobacteraceae bacterium]